MLKKLSHIQKLSSSKIVGLIVFMVFILPTLGIYYNYDISQFTNRFEYYPLTNLSMQYLVNVFIYLIPILVTISISHYANIIEKCSSFIYTRTSRKKEIYQTAVAVYIFGFSLVLIVLITMYAISFVSINQSSNFFPVELRNISFIGVEQSDFPLLYFYYNNPLLFHSFYILYISCYGGLLSLLCYSLSLVIKKGVQIVIFIFSGTMLSILIFGIFSNGLTVWYPQNLLMADPLLATNPGIFTNELGKIFLIFFLITTSMSLIYYEIKENKK